MDKSGEFLRSKEWFSSLTLPEKTRVKINHAFRENMENNPWCIGDKVKRTRIEAEKAARQVENYNPVESETSNNTTKPKIIEGSAPMTENNTIQRSDLNSAGVDANSARATIKGIHDNATK